MVFALLERGTETPLIQVRIFRIRAFSVENLVLGISNLVFIPVFFFASEYAQIALGKSATSASLVLLYFFVGFVVAAQIGGRMLDRIGAKRPVVVGCTLAAVGFWLWGGQGHGARLRLPDRFVILSGAGMGFMLGPASTDAVNRASRLSYGEATGITQTVRNYAASLGLAILGSLLTSRREQQAHGLAGGAGPPEGAGGCTGSGDLEVQARELVGRDSRVRAARLRRGDPLGVLRHGRDHGRGGGRSPSWA